MQSTNTEFNYHSGLHWSRLDCYGAPPNTRRSTALLCPPPFHSSSIIDAILLFSQRTEIDQCYSSSCSVHCRYLNIPSTSIKFKVRERGNSFRSHQRLNVNASNLARVVSSRTIEAECGWQTRRRDRQTLINNHQLPAADMRAR
mmetsp:Transcript_45316/g.95074  ORF Transcript_45316/g.95074 Transcript_45316/m.95074 type:complete len:144 (+) Transcript_45316:133-564(+)